MVKIIYTHTHTHIFTLSSSFLNLWYYQQRMRAPIVLHPFQHLVFLLILITKVGGEWYLIVVLIYISLMINDGEPLFRSLLAITLFPFVKYPCLLLTFSSVVFFLFVEVLYIYYIQTFVRHMNCKCFLELAVGLFIIFMVSFKKVNAALLGYQLTYCKSHTFSENNSMVFANITTIQI